MGDAVGEEGGEGPGGGVAVGGRLVLDQLFAVVVAAGGGVDADAGPGEGVGVEAGVLEGVPAQFEQGPLLGVHGSGLAGCHVEERGVEEVGPLQQRGAQSFGHGSGEAAGRHVVDPALAGGEQRPEGVDVVGAGHPYGHPDDGDVVVPARRTVHRVRRDGPGGRYGRLHRARNGGRIGGGAGGGREHGGQGAQGGVAPDGGGGQVGAEGGADVADQAQGACGVQALFAQGPFGVDGVSEDAGGEGGEPVGHLRPVGGRPWRGGGVRPGRGGGTDQRVVQGVEVGGRVAAVEHGVVEGQDHAPYGGGAGVLDGAEEQGGHGGRYDDRHGQGRARAAEVGEDQGDARVGPGGAGESVLDGLRVALVERGRVQGVGGAHHRRGEVAVVGGAGDAEVDVVVDAQPPLVQAA
ncbi:UNVERIFIED_CONTAM: hypothetical protein RKD43_007141 [Streptomyces graminofaciens]